jgi:hypothetical protein
MVNTQSAQDLIDEISGDSPQANLYREIEQEVEAELHIAIQQELEGNLSSNCAQRLIDTA